MATENDELRRIALAAGVELERNYVQMVLMNDENAHLRQQLHAKKTKPKRTYTTSEARLMTSAENRQALLRQLHVKQMGALHQETRSKKFLEIREKLSLEGKGAKEAEKEAEKAVKKAAKGLERVDKAAVKEAAKAAKVAARQAAKAEKEAAKQAAKEAREAARANRVRGRGRARGRGRGRGEEPGDTEPAPRGRGRGRGRARGRGRGRADDASDSDDYESDAESSTGMQTASPSPSPTRGATPSPIRSRSATTSPSRSPVRNPSPLSTGEEESDGSDGEETGIVRINGHRWESGRNLDFQMWMIPSVYQGESIRLTRPSRPRADSFKLVGMYCIL
ncbi:hypothetical protein DFH09DRAFT_1126034 [Mycena vulgaris]|nr:hypothetical protein DFH09DRAFT_1126034 [Mycena vulgaris]